MLARAAGAGPTASRQPFRRNLQVVVGATRDGAPLAHRPGARGLRGLGSVLEGEGTMTAEWLSYITTEPDGTWRIAFRRLSFETAMSMMKVYVAHVLAQRAAADVSEYHFPDEGIA